MNGGVPLLEVADVCLRYRGMERAAVDGVSLVVEEGISLALVGESGSGKSSLARCMIGLEQPCRGGVMYRGQPLDAMTREDRGRFRRKVQMVFQDPYHSLNPRMTIGSILGEVLHVHRLAAREEIPDRVAAVLEQVGLRPDIASCHPHELSGGQRQRTGIARALLLEPEVILADEPVSALDVSVQAQILNLMTGLAASAGITFVLIAHDLAVVRQVCQRIAVMKNGVIVEQGNTESVIARPAHSYTAGLLAAAPDIDRWLSAGGGGAA